MLVIWIGLGPQDRGALPGDPFVAATRRRHGKAEEEGGGATTAGDVVHNLRFPKHRS